MSGLPTAIQAQLDQAAEIEAQVYGTPAPDTGNPVDVAPVPTTAVQPPEVAQPTQVTSPSSDLEHRFKVLQGKYNAETPRLHAQVRELSEKLEQAVSALQSKADAPKQPEPKLVTDADVEAYGVDLVDMMRRVVQDEFKGLAQQLAAELDKRYAPVAEQVQRQEQRIVQSDEEKFWSKVCAPDAAPDFAEVNGDPKWFEFLDTRAPGTSFTRRELAEEALRRLDAPALIEQVAEFKAAQGIVPAPVPEVPKPQPKPSRPSLNSQVAPSSSRATAPTPATPGKIWTSAEYAAAMDHRRMQTVSREEYEAGVAEADLALAEGRVAF